jgi:hypothetical protein
LFAVGSVILLFYYSVPTAIENCIIRRFVLYNTSDNIKADEMDVTRRTHNRDKKYVRNISLENLRQEFALNT